MPRRAAKAARPPPSHARGERQREWGGLGFYFSMGNRAHVGFNGLDPLTEAVMLRMNASENAPINRGGQFKYDRLC